MHYLTVLYHCAANRCVVYPRNLTIFPRKKYLVNLIYFSLRWRFSIVWIFKLNFPSKHILLRCSLSQQSFILFFWGQMAKIKSWNRVSLRRIFSISSNHCEYGRSLKLSFLLQVNFNFHGSLTHCIKISGYMQILLNIYLLEHKEGFYGSSYANHRILTLSWNSSIAMLITY